MTTIQQLLVRSYERFPEQVALRDERRSLTYGELDSVVSGIVRAFGDWGLKAGDRVATIAGNCVEYAAVDQACLVGGFVRMGINRRSHVSEALALMERTEVALVLADEQWFTELSRVREWPTGRRLVSLGADSDGRAFLDRLDRDRTGVDRPTLDPGDPAVLLFTSGTSGAPKAITITQGNLAGTARNMMIEVEIEAGDRVLHPIPMSHAAGNLLLAFACRGADQMLLSGFDPLNVLEIVESERVNVLTAVPTVLAALARARPGFAGSLGSLRAIVYGGSSISGTDLKAAVDAFGETLHQMYAQSEGSLPLTRLSPGDHLRAVGDRPDLAASAGRPTPFVDLRVMDAQGEFCPSGTRGEIVMRGDTVMAGYWKDPAATAAVIDERGWLHTGDVGYISSDGFVFVVDRLRDLIITGGFNVFPAEVEAAVRRVEGVVDGAVYGVDDEKWGELVCVAVVTDGRPVTLESVQEECRRTISAYKVPRALVVRESLPVNATGKVLRRELRAQHGVRS